MHYLSTLTTACCMLLLAGGIGSAQETKTESSTAPATALPENYFQITNGPRTMDLDPVTLFPAGGPPYSLFSPFYVYARPTASISTGRGSLAQVLNTGIGVDVGIRSLLYNDERTAAWYGDVGLGYIYNNSKDNDINLIVRDGPVTVSRFGSLIQLDGITSLGIKDLHRVHTRLTLGREFYFQSSWFNGMNYSLGGDFGGIWGQATVKTTVNDREVDGLQPTDQIVYNPSDGHTSGVTKGFFVGTNFNVIFPRRTHDFIIGTRLEWQREYFNKLVDNNDGASQLKLMLEAGWRF